MRFDHPASLFPRIGLLVLGAALPLITTVCAGEDDEVAELRRQAENKRGAIIVTKDLMNNGNWAHLGCFISQDGLAVFAASAFGTRDKPIFSGIDGVKLKEPRLLHIDSEYGLAFADFDIQPGVWIEPRKEKVPDKQEQVGILTMSDRNPVLTGPVWGRISTVDPNHLSADFQLVMTIAAGIPVGHPDIGTGSPVIDAKGRLCGIFESVNRLEIFTGGSQKQLTAVPSDRWFDAVAQARSATEPIPYPLEGAVNPLDPAEQDPRYARAVWAMMKGEHAEGIAHAEAALKDHPGSRLVLSLCFDLARSARPEEVMKFAKMRVSAPGAGEAENALRCMIMGHAHRFEKDLAKAEECYRQAAKLSPDSFAPPRWELAKLLSNQGKTAEAINWGMKAREGAPGHLALFYALQKWMTQQGRWEEEAEISEQIDILEKLYQPVTH